MHQSPASSVVVGIDGSRSAVDAALWAADEAVSRDIPLRLVYAIDPGNAVGTDPQAAARELATAEVAVRHAFSAIEATDRPVKIEVEILQARPTQALRDAWNGPRCSVLAPWDSSTAPRERSGRPRQRWRLPLTVPSPSSGDTTPGEHGKNGWSPR